MIRPLLLILMFFAFSPPAEAQKRSVSRKSAAGSAVQEKTEGQKAIVIDERLAVLRSAPSLYARPLQRMRLGREVIIGQTRQADGVTFFQIVIPAETFSGWLQAEAVTGRFRPDDDLRLARLIQASEGFARIERAGIFLEMYPESPFHPLILLLYGDLAEEAAGDLSRQAAEPLSRSEMAASGAPLHSFYLNSPLLDPYRQLGIVFLFNARTGQYHYDGAVWRKLIANYPESAEAAEAQKRLTALEENLVK